MQTPDLGDIPVHEEIIFFEPLLKSTRKLLDELERSAHAHQTEELACHYVPTRGKKRLWQDIYLVREEWDFFRNYFMGKVPLYYFWEPPLRGLINEDPQFWVMANSKYLKDLCFRERFVVNEFKGNHVKKMPFQNIEYHFQQEFVRILNDDSKVYSLRTQECEKYLKLANAYLPKKQALELHQLVRVLLKVGLHQEINKLHHILMGTVITDPALLRKRIRAIYSVAMKYYFSQASEQQKQKIDALVGKHKGYQGQALKYVDRIVSRSFQAAAKK